jgi:hypothetical protein
LSTVDESWKLREGAQWRDAAVAQAAAAVGLTDPAGLAAVAEAYEVVRDHIAPMVVSVAMDMLVDFRQQVAANPDHKIVFVGRDGDALAMVIRELDPGFFTESCRQVTIPRNQAMRAVLDAESALPRGRRLLTAFRWDFKGEDPRPRFALQRLTAHLRSNGFPLAPGSSVTIVDSSYKGTVQEALAALFPQVTFRGAYIWHGVKPEDPHPGTKLGYLQHVTDGGPGNGWETVAYEYSMRGPLTSPTGYREDGTPIQIPIREHRKPYAGVTEEAIASRYRDPTVRDAVMEANRQAAVDLARHAAAQADPRRYLEPGLRAFREGTHSFRHHATPTTPAAFLTYLNSFTPGGRRRSPARA